MNYEPTLRCEHCGRVVDPRTEFNACAHCGRNPASGAFHTAVGADTGLADTAVTTEDAFEQFLADALNSHAEDNGTSLRIATFAEAVVLTRNKGLVVRIGDAEFQVTIARSRR
jgi:hypothetical protein